MSDPKVGIGDVVITLDGQERILRPTLHAAMTVSKLSNGIVGAIQRVSTFDFDLVTQIIVLGLGMSNNARESRDIPEKVYRTGLMDLVPDVVRYLTILSNGGRPPPSEEVVVDTENPQQHLQ